MNTKKFWCHYIGSDDKPKRRNIELIPIADLLPRMNVKCNTPLWCERDEEQSYSRTEVYYYLYAQLNENVAVAVQHRLSDRDLEILSKTDEDIKVLAMKSWGRDLERATTEEGRQRIQSHMESSIKADIERRERYYESLFICSDFDIYLLTKARWINRSVLRAYEETGSPYLPVLQAMRKQFEEEREERERQRKEAARKAAEEEARKKAEEEAKEQSRLTEEAVKFRNGQSIAGCDVVDLCRRYGIAIHLRTIHNLQQVIYTINGKGSCQYYRRGKRFPTLDGCYKTARELYQYLQNNP